MQLCMFLLEKNKILKATQYIEKRIQCIEQKSDIWKKIKNIKNKLNILKKFYTYTRFFRFTNT